MGQLLKLDDYRYHNHRLRGGCKIGFESGYSAIILGQELARSYSPDIARKRAIELMQDGLLTVAQLDIVIREINRFSSDPSCANAQKERDDVRFFSHILRKFTKK